MSNQTPNVRHLDHRSLSRTRHSDKLLSWLEKTCDRLGLTANEVFDLLRENTAAQIDTMTPKTEES